MTAMTEHYFEHPLARVHYYRFGKGTQAMLCFHGYGMHGKQFGLLAPTLGEEYTFYGFDLFFHKDTRLRDESLGHLRQGITKEQLAGFVEDFCREQGISRFSVISYSMGTHYAAAIVERIPERIDRCIMLAPSCLRPGKLITFFSTTRPGNLLLKKLTLSDTALLRLLKLIRRLGVIDDKAYQILFNEIATPQLRFSFYACATYLKHLATDEKRFVEALNRFKIKSLFIFGRRDFTFPPRIGDRLIPRLNDAQKLVLDENHDLVNRHLALTLSKMLLS